MNQKFAILSRLKALPILAAAALVWTATSALGAETVTIKFEILPSGHISVPVKINGRGPYKVGFDTGAPYTFISIKLGQELGLTRGGGMSMMGINLGGQSSAQVSVGETPAISVPLMMMDHPTVKTLNQVMGGFEGLVGFTYYSRFRMTIDYQKKEMTLKPTDFVAADVMQSMMGLMGMGGRGGAPAQRSVPPRAVVLGLKVEDLGEETIETRVTSVVKGGAAETAGVRVGDKIVGLNERWVFGPNDLYEGVAALAPGLPARLKVVRGDKTMELPLKSRLGL